MAFAYCGIAVCIFICLLGKRTEKIIINPVTIFGLVWAIILFLSTLGFYTLYIPQKDTYRMLLEGLVSFFIGYFFYKVVLSKFRLKKAKYMTNTEVGLRYDLIYAVLAICCIYYIFDLINVIRAVGLFSLQNVQRVLQAGEIQINNSPVRTLMLMFIIQPGSFLLPITTSVDFWFGKRNLKLFSGTILMLIIKMLSTASRSTLLAFVFYFVISGLLYLFLNRRSRGIDKKKIEKKRKIIRVVVVVGIVAFVLMTMSRGAGVFRNLYLNFAMPPLMFEKWIGQVEAQNLVGWGMASANGIFYPIFWVFSKIIGVSMPTNFQRVYDLIMLTDTQWQWIGEKITANAYVSIFWFSFLDGRDIGILVEMFVFGALCAYVYKKGTKSPNAKNIALYCMILYCVIYSFVRMQFAMTTFAIAFFYIKFVVYKRYTCNTAVMNLQGRC